jgi:hypothetical protein
MVFVASADGSDGATTITDPTDWTEKRDRQYSQGDVRQHTWIGAIELTGSESGTFNVATNVGLSAVAQIYRYAAGTHGGVDGVEVTAHVEAEAANPDPPSLTPSWGAADTAWIAVCTFEDSDFVATAAPSSYTGLETTIADTTEDATLSTARRENNIATENPGTFTADSEKYQAFTIAIEPSGGGGGGDPVPAVYAFERTTARTTATDTNFVTAITISAAELASAGFADDDEVIVLVWALLANAGTSETLMRVTYNGSVITSASTPRLLMGASAIERNIEWMGRLDLATLADLDLDVASSSTTDGFMERATVCVIRLADFGTEGTDWVWNKSTTNVAHSTTYSATNRAAVTIPASAETQDWVIFGYIHGAMDSTSVNYEARMMLDGGLVAGDFSEEAESTTEEKTWLMNWVANLSSSTHSVTIESRDDSATAANDHRESAIFAFRKNVWNDIYFHGPGTVSMANATDVQIATITDTLSTDQDVLLYGEGNINLDVISTNGFMWIRKGGSTIIEPVIDDGSGLSNVRSYDATDEPNMSVLAFDAATAGALDYDLFGHHTGGSTENLLQPSFLVWGMMLVPPPAGTNYDETGRLVTIASTVSNPTSSLGMTEALTQTITSTVTEVDQADFNDNQVVTATATISETDRADFNQDLQVLVAAIVSVADLLGMEEDSVITVVATITSTDNFSYDENVVVTISSTVVSSDLLQMLEQSEVVISATINETDRADFNQDLQVVITATPTVVDQLSMTESNQFTITSTITEHDNFSFDENLQVTISSTVVGSDILSLTEATLVNVTATLVGADQMDANDNVSVTISSTTVGTDQADFNDTLNELITSTITVTDVQSGDNSENLDITISCTIVATDRMDGNDNALLSITATITETDQADFNEDLDIDIASSVTGSDQMTMDEDLAVTVSSALTETDQLSMTDAGLLLGLVTVVLGEELTLVDSGLVSITSTIFESDLMSMSETPMVLIESTITSFDTMFGDFGTTRLSFKAKVVDNTHSSRTAGSFNG